MFAGEGSLAWGSFCVHLTSTTSTLVDVDGAAAVNVSRRLIACWRPSLARWPATGLRPGEWIALEHRDIDVESGVWIDNRPFLRCLHGVAVSAWRLGEHDRAETLCWALLWLGPADNRGVSGILPEIIAGARWHS